MDRRAYVKENIGTVGWRNHSILTLFSEKDKENYDRIEAKAQGKTGLVLDLVFKP